MKSLIFTKKNRCVYFILAYTYTETPSKVGISAAPKPRDSIDKNHPHIYNMRLVFIVESRELSRGPNANF